jgi:hypothetical protein
MIGGATMKKHLRVIAKFLPDGTALAKQTEDVGCRCRCRCGISHLSTGCPGSDPAQGMYDWLELMVLHFDAAQRLVDYVKLVQRQRGLKIISRSPDICSTLLNPLLSE